jgi:hypothetical protein
MKKQDNTEKCYSRALLILLALLYLLTILLWLLPHSDSSARENRELAKFPEFSLQSYFDGSYTRGLTLWFSDTVPIRDEIMGLAGQIEKLCGIGQDVTFHGNVQIVATDEVHYITRAEETAVPMTQAPETAVGGTETAEAVVTAADTAAENPDNQFSEFDTNGIVTFADRSMILFGGNKTQGKYYADVLNAYKRSMGEDVNVYAMVVPTAVEFYLPEQYSDYSASEKNQIDYIYENLSGVIPVDAYSKLAEHVNEPIYLKTDHHWSQLGAYYASVAFAETIGETPQPLSDYEEVVRPGYVGSLSYYTNDPRIFDSPEDFVYYRQPLPSKVTFYDYITLKSMGPGHLIYEDAKIQNAYAMFIGADAIHTKIITENKNGKRLCVFKDSFGNAVVPELVPYFEEIYVIDIRFFGMSAIEYMKEKNITDVLFINNIFAANTYSLINGINLLRTEAVGLPEPEISETEIADTAVSGGAPPPETSNIPES